MSVKPQGIEGRSGNIYNLCFTRDNKLIYLVLWYISWEQEGWNYICSTLTSISIIFLKDSASFERISRNVLNFNDCSRMYISYQKFKTFPRPPLWIYNSIDLSGFQDFFQVFPSFPKISQIAGTLCKLLTTTLSWSMVRRTTSNPNHANMSTTHKKIFSTNDNVRFELWPGFITVVFLT